VPYEEKIPAHRGTGNTQELYQQAIRAIIGYLSEGKAVCFHCAGGADRTGSLAFLIEALLGVSESDMSKDYELAYNWATTRHAQGVDPLSPEEIELLRKYLIVKD